MDHFFEQKLVRENQQLQLELVKLNKQIKQLQERVVGYEQIMQQLDEGTLSNLVGRIKGIFNPKPPVNATPTNLPSNIKNASKLKLDDAQRMTGPKLPPKFKYSSPELKLDDELIKTPKPRPKRTKGSNPPESMWEELKGNQHEIDANENGKIDAEDFKLLRKKKVNESHTPEELEKLNKSQLKKLKVKYIGERAKAESSGDTKAANKHGNELKNIMSLLSDKSIKEELLNEIGETRRGQTALKLARARAESRKDWDKSVSTTFAQKFGQPGDVEKVKKDIGASERTIQLANKRLKPNG